MYKYYKKYSKLYSKQDCKAAYSPKLAAAFKELVKSKNIGRKFEFSLDLF